MTKRSNSAKKQNQKTVPRNKAVEADQSMEENIARQEEYKGPFYVWNMPIMPEDLAKL